MKTLKAAILVVVMAPVAALAAGHDGTVQLLDPSQLRQLIVASAEKVEKPSVAHEEGVTSNPTASSPSAASAAPTATTTGPTATTTSAVTSAADPKEKQGLSIAVDLDHWLGTGTFINPQYYSYLAANLSVSARYAFKVKEVKLAASLAGRVTYEYTLPDNGNARRFAPWDTRLGLSAPALYKHEYTGITVSPSLGLVIPTTIESWHAGLITSLSAGVAVTKHVWKLDFMLNGSGSRGFHVNPQNAIAAQNAAEADTTRSSVGQLTVLSRAGETLSDSSTMNTAWVAIVGGSAKLSITDDLSFSLGYTYIHYWKYKLPVDQFTPQALDNNGNPVAVGEGQAERTFAVVSADYQLTEHYGLSLSASTIQTPRSGANGGAGYFRFPFWAVNDGPANATSVNLTFSAAF